MKLNERVCRFCLKDFMQTQDNQTICALCREERRQRHHRKDRQLFAILGVDIGEYGSKG